MDEIITIQDDRRELQDDRRCEPLPIGEVLSELFARYEARYPDLQIAVVHATAEAA